MRSVFEKRTRIGMFKKLRNALPDRLTNLEAKLSGVNGYTGRGKIAFTAWRNGAKAIAIDLRGVAGRDAEIQLNDKSVLTVNFDKGRLAQKFNSRKGHDVPDLAEGAQISIVQNGVIILEGVLIPD